MTNIIIKEPVLKKISELISEMDKDKLCLPDFQREFVWKPEQMAKLIESVIRHYPIGTLIFLNAEMNQKFGKRSFKGTPEQDFEPDWYVIDGQQRMNTFFLLLKEPKGLKPFRAVPYRKNYYKAFFKINQSIDNLPSDVDKPEFIIMEKVEEEYNDEYFKNIGKRKIIPLEFVLNEELTKHWIKKTLEKISLKKRRKYERNIRDIRNRILEYKCVIENIETPVASQDHYNIFQLLNEAGTDLNIFDLAVAKLNTIGINLRKLWKQARKNYPEIDSFDIDPVYILKIISMIRDTKDIDVNNKNPTCTGKDLKKLHMRYKKSEFEKDWHNACEYLDMAIFEMKNGYGVYSKKYIPYSPMLITLASIKWWIDKIEKFDQRYKKKIRKKLKRWYWGSILNSEYEAQTDNIISNHYKSLMRWLNPRARNIPNQINFKFNKKDIYKILNKIESSADARYKAIICLPLTDNKNAKDIFSDEFLTPRGAKLHDHHIYPSKFLEDMGYKDRNLINNVANRMLITEGTNQQIKKQSPYDYLIDVKSKAILTTHFLFRGIVSKKMEYKDFLEKRKKLICEFLCRYLDE